MMVRKVISVAIREELHLMMNTIVMTEAETLTEMIGDQPEIKAEALKVADGIHTKMTMIRCQEDAADDPAIKTDLKDVSKCLILMMTEAVTEDKEIHRADITKDVIQDTIRNLI